jgi:hypothetical protein
LLKRRKDGRGWMRFMMAGANRVNRGLDFGRALKNWADADQVSVKFSYRDSG